MTMERMAAGARDAGAEVTLLVSAHGERRDSEERVNGIRIIRCGEWARVASTPLCPSMPARLRSIEADIVHLHYPSPPGEVSYLLDPRRIRSVVTYHCDVVRQVAIMRFYRPFAEAVLDRASVIMPTSPQYIEYSEFLRPRRDRCQVVPHGIDLEPFLHPERHESRAAEIRRENGTPLIVFVGRFRYYKGLEFLVRAMVSVKGNLLLVGSGPERARLAALREELGLEDRVRFAGDVDNPSLPAHYAAADVCVLPSSHATEAFGLVLIEAMAAGRPVVSTELGTGTSFVNQDGVTGLVVPPRDPEALAAALNRLIAEPGTRARFGLAGRERARTLFSSEAMIRALLPVYERALAQPRR